MRGLKPVGRRGKRLRDRGLIFGPLCDFVRGGKCEACRDPGEPHHVKSRGAGYGDWLTFVDDYNLLIDAWGNVVPLCRDHHNELHQYGQATFEGTYLLDLSVRAQAWGEVFKMRRPEEWHRIEAVLGG
jgi:hypothetical protein